MLEQLLKHQAELEARFKRAMSQLADPETHLTAETLYSLSDLEGDHLAQFRVVWQTMSVERRRSLVARLVETAETNFDLDFSAILTPALRDEDPAIRLSAIEGVFEDSPRAVIEQLLSLAQGDPLTPVRAAAAQALGIFVLKGELGKLPAALNQRLQDTMWALHANPAEPLEVRRRALEALSNCTRDGVADLIRDAYHAAELPMRISAVFAMGRSCDDVWQALVLDELSSEHAEMRFEAARAAGELELRPAVPRLAELAYEDDREIQEMAVWALGEIGGSAAQNVLRQLAALADERDDEELAQAVGEAQDMASLAGQDLIPLFDFSDYDGDIDDDDDMVVIDADDQDRLDDEFDLDLFEIEDRADLDTED